MIKERFNLKKKIIFIEPIVIANNQIKYNCHVVQKEKFITKLVRQKKNVSKVHSTSNLLFANLVWHLLIKSCNSLCTSDDN